MHTGSLYILQRGWSVCRSGRRDGRGWTEGERGAGRQGAGAREGERVRERQRDRDRERQREGGGRER